MIPIPVDGGVCYKCNGEKYIYKWVKAYTDKEYAQYIKTQEKARDRRRGKEEARIQSLKDKSEENRKEALIKLGFDIEDPAVYLVTGKTFEIKDVLKERGGRFNPSLNWHFNRPTEVPEGHELVKVPFDEVYEWLPMVKRVELKDNAKEVADAAKIAAMPPSKSEWVGSEKERLRSLKVVLTGARECSSAYGLSTLFTFSLGDNILTWFTTSEPKVDIAIGDEYLLTGTVKKHTTYNGEKQTQLSRCILKEVAI